MAKLCGVKCEKFYLGFDIAGLKFCKFRWGETEYGIGILPLGGYVKMLGQEDNPARLREEMERAKAEGGRDEGESGSRAERSAEGAAIRVRTAQSSIRIDHPTSESQSAIPNPRPLTIPAASWPRAFRNAWPSSRRA